MKLLKTNSICVMLFLLFISIQSHAQNLSPTKAKIIGTLKDAKSLETIPFASAVLTNKETKAVVKIAQTSIDGDFNLDNLPQGTFTFRMSYVGYQTLVRDNIIIKSTTGTLNFGDLKMNLAAGNNLDEVTITSQKAAMQLGVDKKVFSVEQSLVSEGGTATDVLQNVPSVQADIDGNFTLRGSSGVRVLIDGKPSLIAGGDVAQILQSIPASSIENIEVITNPSSKYDAEGQAGIINIVLKRNNKLGFNGNASISAGSKESYNASTNLSFQNSKINLFGNYGFRNNNRFGDGYNTIFYKNPINNISHSNQYNDYVDLNKGHNLKAGIDYYIAPKSVLSLTGGLNMRDGREDETVIMRDLSLNGSPYNLSDRTNLQKRTGDSYNVNLDFVQKFKKPGQELSFSSNFSKGDNNNYSLFNTNRYFQAGSNIVQDPFVQKINRLSDNQNINVQVDYSMPIGKTGKFEAGLRSQNNQSESNTLADSLINNVYQFSKSLSNDFNSKEQIHAVYANYQNQIGKFGYQVGLRGEDASLDTQMGSYQNQTDLVYTPGRVAYTRLYPSVFLTQKLEKEQQLQVSYSRRVNRPRGWDINPFLDVSNAVNHRMGNPNLLPEDVHSFELSYSKYFKKVTFMSTVYFRQTNDVIQRLRSEPDENGITLTIPQNLANSKNSGLELIGKFDLVKKWNFTLNANLYQRNISGTSTIGDLSNNGFSYNINLTNNITLPYNITLQFRADYRAKEVMAQGVMKAMYGFDAGAKMDILDKRASLSLNVRNLFGARKWQSETDTQYSLTGFGRNMMANFGNLTFSYRFGKTVFNLKKNRKPNNDAPMSDEETF